MTDTPDAELLEQFARNQSEAAFAELVKRHIGLVYSVAFRRTGNPQQSEDVTQAVFIILARKAGSLGAKTVLPGWLYHTARLTAANAHRSEMRRTRREQEAFMQSTLKESGNDAFWAESSSQLDEAMACLGASERDALVLRYFQNKSVAEVGTLLGVRENTAQKRVGRALDKLRRFFARRGVVSTTAIIAGAISANSVQAAPEGLAETISAAAIAKGATASTSTLTLIKGALKLMAWTKAKSAIVIGAGVLLAAGIAAVAVKITAGEGWQKKYDPNLLFVLPAEVKILPSLPSTVQTHTDLMGVHNGRAMLGLGQSVPELLNTAYQVPQFQLLINAPIPDGKYDFFANLPTWDDNIKAMREEIEKKFGLTGRREVIHSNVLILTVKWRHAPGLEPATRGISNDEGPDHYSAHDESIVGLDNYLNENLGSIIVDKTGREGNLDIDFKWDGTHEGLKRALFDYLGLQLVPTNMPVEMVIVEKTK